jgi:hypothetical protein
MVHKFHLWAIITYRCQTQWIRRYNLIFLILNNISTIFFRNKKSLIRLDLSCPDGFYTKIYNKFLYGQVNKQVCVSFFLNKTYLHDNRPESGPPSFEFDLSATVQCRYLSDARIKDKAVHPRISPCFFHGFTDSKVITKQCNNIGQARKQAWACITPDVPTAYIPTCISIDLLGFPEKKRHISISCFENSQALFVFMLLILREIILPLVWSDFRRVLDW